MGACAVILLFFCTCNEPSPETSLQANDTSVAGGINFPTLVYRLDSGKSNLITWLRNGVPKQKPYDNYTFQFLTNMPASDGVLQLLCYPQTFKLKGKGSSGHSISYPALPDTLKIFSVTSEVTGDSSVIFGSIVLKRCQLVELVTDTGVNSLLFVPCDTLRRYRRQVVYKIYKTKINFATGTITDTLAWKTPPCLLLGDPDPNNQVPVEGNPCPPATMFVEGDNLQTTVPTPKK